MYKCDNTECTWWGEHPAPKGKCPVCQQGVSPMHYILHESLKENQEDEFQEVMNQLRELIKMFAGLCNMDPQLLGCVLILMFFKQKGVSEAELARKCKNITRAGLNKKLKPFKEKGYLI